MSRTKKIVLGVIAAVVVLVIAALAAVSLLLNPNAYKDRIAAAAENALGRKVQIEGDLSLSVFPWVVIETGAIRVENPAEFGGGDFVSLKQAALSVKLMPLLTGSVRVDKVTATDMVVLLVKDKNGRGNWEFKPAPADAGAQGAGQDTAQDTGEAPAASSGDSAGQGLDIAISSLELVNADITYRDLAAGATYQVKQFNFKGDNLVPGEEFAMTASGLAIATKEALSAGFKLDTAGEVNPLTMTGTLSSVNFSVNAEGKGVPGGKAALDFAGNVDASQGLKLIVLTIDSLKANAMDADLSLSGKAEIPQDYRQTRLNVSSLEAQGFDGKLSFKGDIAPLALNGKGEISMSGSIKKLLAALGSPMQTQNPAALEKFELASPIELTPDKGINLSNLDMTLDSTKIAGNLAVNPGALMGGKGGLTVNSVLKIDAVNVDDYLPVKGAAPAKTEGAAPKSADAGAGGGQAAAGGKSGGASPLNTLSGKIDFSVGKLTAAKAVLSDLKGVLTMQNGAFTLSPCTFNAFSGQVNATAKANMAPKPMPLALDLNVKGMALGEVMQFVSGDQKITGNTDLTLNVTGAGDSWPTISKTLGGSGAVAVRDGVIRQIKLVPDSAANVGIAGVAPLKPLDGKLQSLTATFKGANGRFNNNDLNVISSIANITGAGWVDLGQNGIGYELLVGTGGYNIPVVVSGALNSPSTGIDGQKFLKANAEQLLKDGQGVGNIVTDPRGTLQGLGESLGVGGASGGTGGTGTSGGTSGTSGGTEEKSLKDKAGEALKSLF